MADGISPVTKPTETLKVSAKAKRQALRILARSVYKELTVGGYDRSAMLAFTNELLEVITTGIVDEDRQVGGDAE